MANYGVLATNQITVSASAVLILQGNTARNQAQAYNSGPNVVYVGQTSSVTTATGYPVAVGAAFTVQPYKGDVYAIGAGGTSQLVGVLETN